LKSIICTLILHTGICLEVIETRKEQNHDFGPHATKLNSAQMNKAKKIHIPLLLAILFLFIPSIAAGKSAGILPEIIVDQRNLYATVKYLTEIKPSRNYYNVQSLQKTASYIKKQFKKYGITCETQEFEVNGQTYSNIIGIINKNSSARIIIGAHYDVCGDQPGADDNASGVAGLLETARLLKEHLNKSDFRYDFVAYTLEEPPFFRTNYMGSYIHAKSMFDEKTDVRGMISLEMLGYFSDEPGTQAFPLGMMKLFYPSKGNFIAVISNFKSGKLLRHVEKYMNETNIPVSSLIAPTWITGVDFSDHRSYWQFGYKAVMITDTSFYRNSNYHKVTDTIETLDFEKMKEVLRGVVLALINIQKL